MGKRKKSPAPAARPAAPVAAPAAPAAAPQQGIPPAFDGMRGMAYGMANGVANGLPSRSQKSAPMPPPQTPQWSAASYEPSQFQNMSPAQAQAPWGGGRQMPQQQGNEVRRIPQQSSPTVQALRGGQ